MESNGNNRGLRMRKAISAILIVLGLLLILVPLVMTYHNTKRNSDVIEEFLRQSEQAVTYAESLDTDDLEDFYIPESMVSGYPSTSVPEPTETPTPENSSEPLALENEQPSNTPAPSKKPRMTKEEILKRTIGVLIIPKIDVKILIMDGVDNLTLSVAAGRLPGTGEFDKIGNCVLAGHRSHTFGKYLNRLDELIEGDEITIQTPDKTLKYSVYKKHIIEPDDFSITNQTDTEKILTLFTCHPPGIGSHRLVVHAKQLE